MSTAVNVLIVAGMLNLLVGALSGIPMAIVRQRGEPVVPKYLTMVHLGGLMHGPLLLGIAFAMTISTVTPWLATTAALILAVASGLLVIKDTINWRQGVTDEFAEQSLGLRIGTIFGPLHVDRARTRDGVRVQRSLTAGLLRVAEGRRDTAGSADDPRSVSKSTEGSRSSRARARASARAARSGWPRPAPTSCSRPGPRATSSRSPAPCASAAAGRSSCPTDVTDAEQRVHLVDATMAEYGRLDILVNNAGGWLPRPFLQTSERNLEAALRFNVTTAFVLSQLAVPHMVAGGGGAIVNISSRSASMVQPAFTAYAASKAALSMLTRAMAPELAPKVRVNAIEVGGVETAGLATVLTDDSIREQLEGNTPMHRVGQPEDIAAAVLYLVSDASSWVTGKIFEVDGGVEAPAFTIPVEPL